MNTGVLHQKKNLQTISKCDPQIIFHLENFDNDVLIIIFCGYRETRRSKSVHLHAYTDYTIMINEEQWNKILKRYALTLTESTSLFIVNSFIKVNPSSLAKNMMIDTYM